MTVYFCKLLYYFTQQMHNACNYWLQRSSVMISLFFNITGCVIKSRWSSKQSNYFTERHLHKPWTSLTTKSGGDSRRFHPVVCGQTEGTVWHSVCAGERQGQHKSCDAGDDQDGARADRAQRVCGRVWWGLHGGAIYSPTQQVLSYYFFLRWGVIWNH